MDFIHNILSSGILSSAACILGITVLAVGWIGSIYLIFINIKDYTREKDILSIIGVLIGLILTSLMVIFTGAAYEYVKTLI